MKLNEQQMTWLKGKGLTQQILDLLQSGTIALPTLKPLLCPPLDAAEYEAVVREAAAQALAVPVVVPGFPSSTQLPPSSGQMIVPVVPPGQLVVPLNPQAGPAATQGLDVVKIMAAKMTRTGRDGKIYPGGLAAMFRNDLSLWPTTDAFGRPFPSLQVISTWDAAQIKRCVTTGGFPKCSLDSLNYMFGNKGGKSLFLLSQMHNRTVEAQMAENARAAAEGRAPLTVTLDNVADDIAPNTWRGYNGAQRPADKYWLPSQHQQVCQLNQISPVEYAAIMAAQPAAAVEPAQIPVPVIAKRSRK